MGLGGEFLQPGAQFLLEELLVCGSVAGAGHGGRLHQLMVTAEAGATAERRRRLLSELAHDLGGELGGADALPTGLATGVAHGEVTLPRLTAHAVAEHAGPFQAVTTALRAIQRNLIVGPGHSAREARTQLGAQIFDGQDGLRTDLQGRGGRHGRAGQRGTSNQVRQGRRKTQAGTA